jgi:hypothetical protein
MQRIANPSRAVRLRPAPSSARWLLSIALALLVNVAASQPLAKLNDPSFWVPLSEETSTLAAEDLATLQRLRARNDFYKVIRVTRRLDLDVLRSERFAFVTPHGETVVFTGRIVDMNRDGSRTWHGDSIRSRMTVTFGANGVWAEGFFEGRSYMVLSIGPANEVFLLAEVMPKAVRD